MRLRKQSRDSREYDLSDQEIMCLRMLIHTFPVAMDLPNAVSSISRTESNHQVAERQRLLNDSLAGHRNELKRKAAGFLDDGKLTAEQDGWRLRLSVEEREFLLQLLNDVRISSWRAIGEPENIAAEPSPASEQQLTLHNLMQLAGYFESELLQIEDAG